MTTLSRLILALALCSLLTVGCQPASATPTLPPATATPVSPTATPLPATETPALEPAISSSLISAGNASQLKQIAALELPESMLNTLVFSPDSRTLISGDASGEVNLWERGTWQKNAFLAPQSDFKRDADEKPPFYGTLALSPNGKVIVTTNSDGEVKGQDWDGKERFTFPLGDPVYSTAISPDSKYLAAGGLSKNLIIVDLETNQQVADLSNDYEYISNLVFSPDDKSLLASYERPGNVMKTWDTATWKEIETFSHTTERFDYHDILFAPDGKSLVIASTRNDIEFLDLETKQVIKKLQGHPRAPYQIAFSPNGSLLASASDDMTLRLWDLKTGKAVLVLRNQHEVGTVAFSPDGTLLAFGVWGEGFQVWALDSAVATASSLDSMLLVDSGRRLQAQRTFSIALGDLDRDGDLDAVVTDFLTSGKVWLNDGTGVFISGQKVGAETIHGVALGDLDGDGDLDAFVIHNKGIDQVWLNDGMGKLIDSGQQLGTPEDYGASVTLGDVDGDGDLDAFTAHYQHLVGLWLNDGHGVFAAYVAGLGSNHTSATEVALGDVDGDGDLDALVSFDEKPNRLWLNDGRGNFVDSGQNLDDQSGWGGSALGDVDGDGDLDAFIANPAGGDRVWFNTGGAQAGTPGIFADSGQVLGQGKTAILGDMDNDGDLDALSCEGLWLNDGSGVFSDSGLKFQSPNCSGLSLGDVDGDGDLDIIFENAAFKSDQKDNELWLNRTH